MINVFASKACRQGKFVSSLRKKKKEKLERERKEQIEKEKQRRKEGHLIRNQMEEYEKIVRQQEIQQQMKMREEMKV